MERASVECPECAASITLDQEVISGEIVQCGECGVELEVVRNGGIAVRRAPDEEEDWGE